MAAPQLARIMTGFVSAVVGVVVLLAVGYAGYLGGRDAAERKASETISNLRRQVSILRAQRDRAVENNSRLARTLGLHRVEEPDVPDWMQS